MFLFIREQFGDQKLNTKRKLLLQVNCRIGLPVLNSWITHFENLSLTFRPHLFERQQHELLGFGHLHKVLQDIFVGRLEQVAAGVCISEATDAQAVRGVQLTEQELAASVSHSVQLQEAGRREQRLHTSHTQPKAMKLNHSKDILYITIFFLYHHRAWLSKALPRLGINISGDPITSE